MMRTLKSRGVLAAVLLLLACTIIPLEVSAAAADAAEATSSTSSASSVPSKSADEGVRPIKPIVVKKAAKANDLLLLPQANAADLASGAADHIVRAAFLGGVVQI
jgi:hypothetical protein